MKQAAPHPFRFSIPLLAFTAIFFYSSCLKAQPLHGPKKFTKQDTLRGSLTPERAWWNVTHYNIQVTPDFNTQTIRGWNQLSFDVANPDGKSRIMQIDLQQPMQLDSVWLEGGTTGNKAPISFRRNGSVFYLDFPGKLLEQYGNQVITTAGKTKNYSLRLYFSGKPRKAVTPPWDGGWIWARDDKGRPWMSVACQGLGASVWYPCKDYQGDEPDSGAMLQVRVPDTLVAVANGKLYSEDDQQDGTKLWTWEVKNPINNYNIVPYIGKYVHFSDTYIGETEKNLSLDYWVLDYELPKAKKQFDRDVKRMLKAFEYWFSPYPFYEDGYKLVESPHLGMEHQSATAYGNHFLDGYLGSDLSGSGWGLKWDYIIVHESGHEWFGNSITTRDIADMWVHEGFTMYSEPLFIEYYYGKKAADAYVQGIRNNISNDIPIIGPYDVNQEGSGDMYNKGANMLHTIRQVINNDSLFRSILRSLNTKFYHRVTTSAEVEQLISKESGIDFSKVFDQYLRTVMIPELQYKIAGNKLQVRWSNVVKGFAMPVRLQDGSWVKPTTQWTTLPLPATVKAKGLEADKNFYVTVKAVK